MKINVDKNTFLKSWSLAERSAGTSGSMNIFSSILLRADENGTELQATDIKTSIVCAAQGVTVVEPGETVIPLKGVSDLFKKAGSSEFTLQVQDGRAVMLSGKSRYRFTTYPVADFPKLPSSEGAALFCSLPAATLVSSLDRGSLCASANDEYPQYLSSVFFEMENGALNIVSTDKRRLALSRCEVTEGSVAEPLLLPLKGLKELQRILGMLDAETAVRISYDDAQAYFSAQGMEFAVRKVESKFPPYAKILPTSSRTSAHIDRADLIAAIERVDIVVRDYNRTVIVRMAGDGECTLSGRAPEFGEAVEQLFCEAQGENVVIGVNTRYFHDAVKVLDDPVVLLGFNGQDGHMAVRAKDSDSFLCLVAPVELSREEIDAPVSAAGDEEMPADTESGGDVL